ncbi:MAG: hypothetical protein IPH76_16405 [Xanthomonadales bacterium]|nr:hypothetical protein [Xanthomonadales bacterium]
MRPIIFAMSLPERPIAVANALLREIATSSLITSISWMRSSNSARPSTCKSPNSVVTRNCAR